MTDEELDKLLDEIDNGDYDDEPDDPSLLTPEDYKLMDQAIDEEMAALEEAIREGVKQHKDGTLGK